MHRSPHDKVGHFKYGTIVEANDGTQWFKGELGWYEYKDEDSYLDPQEEVPTGIAEALHIPRQMHEYWHS